MSKAKELMERLQGPRGPQYRTIHKNSLDRGSSQIRQVVENCKRRINDIIDPTKPPTHPADIESFNKFNKAVMHLNECVTLLKECRESARPFKPVIVDDHIEGGNDESK